MKSKKNKALLGIVGILLILLLSPILIPISIIALIYTPIDYLRFRMSAFYKETGHKYKWIITTAETYRIHRIATNEGLNIKYFKDDEDNGNTGFFICGDCLLVFDLGRGSLIYDRGTDSFTAFHRERWKRVEDILEGEKERFYEKHGIRPAQAKVIYSRTGFDSRYPLSEEDMKILKSKAEESELFLLYDGKKALYEALTVFVKENS